MRALAIGIGALALLPACGAEAAASKADRCASYAHEATANTPASTGPMRGAARGAILGGVLGNAGAGAATGAVVGTARKSNQKHKSYQYYYDRCMRG